MARLVRRGDIRGRPLSGRLDAAERVLAPCEARRQGGPAAVLERQEVPLEPRPPVPAPRTAPGDQPGAAVEAVAHQHRPRPPGWKAGRSLRRLAPLGKAD